MSITVNLRYTGTNGSARKFAEEMISSGTVELIRNEPGNLRYEYYLSVDDPETAFAGTVDQVRRGAQVVAQFLVFRHHFQGVRREAA